MNGSCGTNDAGAGGVSPTNVTPCDNNVVNKDIQTQGGRTGTGGRTRSLKEVDALLTGGLPTGFSSTTDATQARRSRTAPVPLA